MEAEFSAPYCWYSWVAHRPCCSHLQPYLPWQRAASCIVMSSCRAPLSLAHLILMQVAAYVRRYMRPCTESLALRWLWLVTGSPPPSVNSLKQHLENKLCLRCYELDAMEAELPLLAPVHNTASSLHHSDRCVSSMAAPQALHHCYGYTHSVHAFSLRCMLRMLPIPSTHHPVPFHASPLDIALLKPMHTQTTQKQVRGQQQPRRQPHVSRGCC